MKQSVRKSFLKTLCILSIIGIALWITRDIKMYFEYKSMVGWMNKESFLVGIALNMMILFGVLLMMKSKKIGFYMYAPFQLIWLTLPFFIGTWVDTYFGFLVLPAGIFTPIFIVLYSMNLKHMY